MRPLIALIIVLILLFLLLMYGPGISDGPVEQPVAIETFGNGD